MNENKEHQPRCDLDTILDAIISRAHSKMTDRKEMLLLKYLNVITLHQ